MLEVSLRLEAGPLAYDRHVTALMLRRVQLPALDRLVVLLPHGVAVEAVPGEEVALDLDGGEGSARVFTGLLDRLVRTAEGVRLEAVNGGSALAAFRPALSLQSLSAGDAIRRLTGDMEVDVDVGDDGPDLSLLALDGRETAAERIAALARLTGQGCAFDGDGQLRISAAGGVDDRMALKYGREILSVETVEASAAGPSLNVVGEGAGEASVPRGRLPSADFDLGSAGAPGPTNRRISIPDVRSTDAAQAASGALALGRLRLLQRAKLTTFLLPAVAPGMEIELADMPAHLPLAAMRVTQVVHIIRPWDGAITEISGTGATSTDPLAFLGDLAGALTGALGGALAGAFG
jgi:hypothetical protein